MQQKRGRNWAEGKESLAPSERGRLKGGRRHLDSCRVEGQGEVLQFPGAKKRESLLRDSRRKLTAREISHFFFFSFPEFLLYLGKETEGPPAGSERKHVHLGCYKNIPWMGWLTKTFTSHRCGGWKPEVNVNSMVQGGPFRVADLSQCPQLAERTRELHGISLTRAQIPLMRALLSWPLISSFFLLIENVIIVESHAVVRSNTERPLVHFAQFSPMVTCCKTTQISQPRHWH